MKKRTVVLGASGMLLLGVGIGGSLAWLLDETEQVTNTFTTSNIEIILDESELQDDGTLDENKRVQSNDDYKMVPGMVLPKDPAVTVKAGSEDCWLFIEVTESGNVENYIDYDIDPNNWFELKDENNESIAGVYYCGEVTDIDADRSIKILGYTDADDGFHPNEVLVKDTVTKEMMDALEKNSGDEPALTFKAYAAQLYKNNTEKFTALEAWRQVKPNQEANGGETSEGTN